MKPIQMNGIKLSNPLAQLNQRYETDARIPPVYLYRLLSSHRINISFLNTSLLDGEKCIACCVDPDTLGPVKNHLQPDRAFDHRLEYITHSGTISVYPHKGSLASLGHILHAMGKENFVFSHMASSAAMLTFVVALSDQERIAKALAQYIRLPVSHAPFRQEPCSDELLLSLKNALETTACYVEPKIKTYGIKAITDLTLCCLDFSIDQLAAWGERIESLEGLGIQFYFASGFKTLTNRVQLLLLVGAIGPGTEVNAKASIASALQKQKNDSLSIKTPMGFICFQGPHFGDRYGIADQAFSALIRNAIPILAAGCVGASVNLVIPDAMMQKATQVLSKIFVIPQGKVERKKNGTP